MGNINTLNKGLNVTKEELESTIFINEEDLFSHDKLLENIAALLKTDDFLCEAERNNSSKEKYNSAFNVFSSLYGENDHFKTDRKNGLLESVPETVETCFPEQKSQKSDLDKILKEFLFKQRKCIKQEMDFMARYLDPYNFFLESRARILDMACVSYFYARSRASCAASRPQSSNIQIHQDKVDFINKAFGVIEEIIIHETLNEDEKNREENRSFEDNETNCEKSQKKLKINDETSENKRRESLKFPPNFQKAFYEKVMKLVDTLPKIKGPDGLLQFEYRNRGISVPGQSPFHQEQNRRSSNSHHASERNTSLSESSSSIESSSTSGGRLSRSAVDSTINEETPVTQIRRLIMTSLEREVSIERERLDGIENEGPVSSTMRNFPILNDNGGQNQVPASMRNLPRREVRFEDSSELYNVPYFRSEMPRERLFGGPRIPAVNEEARLRESQSTESSDSLSFEPLLRNLQRLSGFSEIDLNQYITGRHRNIRTNVILNISNENFPCFKLLYVLVEQSKLDAFASLRTKAKQEQVQTATNLLLVLQKELFKKVSTVTKSTNPLVGKFIDYCRQLIANAEKVIRSQLKVLDQKKSSTGEKAYKEFYKRTSTTIEKTFIGRALPLVLLVLYRCFGNAHFYEKAKEIFSSLKSLIVTLQNFSCLSSEKIEGSFFFPKYCGSRVVESMHSYYIDSKYETFVTIPGANRLLLKFSDECQTEKNVDVLTISTKNGEKLLTLSGENKNWPRNCIVVKDSDIKLTFSSTSTDISKNSEFLDFGFKVLVTGFCYDDSVKLWDLDLLKSACCVFGKCGNLLVSKVEISKTEQELKKWLSTSLFNSDESDSRLKTIRQDLKKFIGGDENSMERRINTFMEKTVGVSLLIKHDEKIKETSRYFIAACIHQIGLMSDFEEMLDKSLGIKEPDIPETFKLIWNVAKKLEAFIFEEKQRLLKEIEDPQNITSKLKEETINKICEPMIKKIQYVLTRHPFAKRFFGKNDESNVIEKWVYNFLDFIKSGYRMEDFSECIKLQRARASKRCAGYTCVLQLLTKLRFDSLAISLLYNFFSKEICNFTDSIEACGTNSKRQVEKAAFKFFESLLIILENETYSALLKSVILFGMKFDCSLEDSVFILDADLLRVVYMMANFPVKSNDAHFKNKSVLQHFSERFYHFFCINFTKLEFLFIDNYLRLRIKKEDIVKNVTSIQALLTNQIVKDLAVLINSLWECQESTEASLRYYMSFITNKNGTNTEYRDFLIFIKNKNNRYDYFDMEEKIFYLLNIFSLVSSHWQTIFGSTFESEMILGTMFYLSEKGSPRIQSLAIMILRKFLRLIDTEKFEKLTFYITSITSVRSQSEKESNAASFIKFVFLKISEILILKTNGATQSEVELKNDSQTNFRNGAAVQKLCMDYTMLVRALCSNPSWRKLIVAIIKSSVSKLKHFVSTERNEIDESVFRTNESELRLAASSLIVIGGFPSIFRKGCRVENNDKDVVNTERGSLVNIDREKGLGKVVFDSNPKQTIDSDLMKINPVDEYILKQETISELESLIPEFAPFLDIGDDSLNIFNSNQLTKIKKSKKLESKWSCTLCTYLNEAILDFCAMCNTAKPKILPQSQKSGSIKEKKNTASINVKPETLVLSQLKSLAIRALCILLLKSKDLFESKNFDNFLQSFAKKAIIPTNLSEFLSLERLENIETRILEKVYEKSKGLETSKTVDDAKSYVLLIPFSPFKKLQANLPTHFDTQFSKRCLFQNSGGFCIAQSSNETSASKIAYFKANNPIPLSLKAFYFEVEVRFCAALDSARSFGVAAGLFREGVPLKGSPGNSMSFAYLGKTGEVKHNEDEFEDKIYSKDQIMTKEKTNQEENNDKKTNNYKWGSNRDVVGCGFDSSKRSIFFTKNGIMLKECLQLVNTRLCPIVWSEIPNVEFEINFGQKPFLYNFDGMLDKDYIKELNKEPASTLSLKERKRREKAESLVEMMGSYPIELCIMALERANDDLQSAANWILEHGWRELEKMGDALLETSYESKSVEREEHVHEENFTYSDFNVVRSPNNERNRSQIYLDNEIEPNIPLGMNSSEITRVASRQRNSSIRCHQHFRERSKKISEKLNPKDIETGQILQIAKESKQIFPDLFTKGLKKFLGKTGLVKAVDLNNSSALLEVVDEEIAFRLTIKLPVQCLRKPERVWIDPIQSLFKKDKNGITKREQNYEELLLSTQHASTILRIRRTLIKILQKWPADKPFSNTLLGGNSKFLLFLKLVSAEFLSLTNTNEIAIDNRNDRILGCLRNKIEQIMEIESLSYQPTDKTEIIIKKSLFDSPTQLKKSVESLYKNQESSSFEKLFVEECILHFVQSANNPVQELTVSSPGHSPYQRHVEKFSMIYIPGAKAMTIFFDSRCCLSSDMLTFLKFFKDETKTEVIAKYNGKRNLNNKNYEPIVVHSNRCYYMFKSSGNTNFWGFRFRVIPHTLRIDDFHAADCRNLELGCWMLDLLLNNKNIILNKAYMMALYDSLSWYILKAKKDARSRGIQLLNRIMLSFQKCPIEKIPPVSVLEPLYKEVKKILTMSPVAIDWIPSQLTQGLLELLSVIKLVKLIHKKKKSSKKIDAKKSSARSYREIGRVFMKVIKAELFIGEKAFDATEALSRYISSFADFYLILPRREEWKKFLFIPEDNFYDEVLVAQSNDLNVNLSMAIVRCVFDNETMSLGYKKLKKFSYDTQGVKELDKKVIMLELKDVDQIKEISKLTLGTDKVNKLKELEFEAKKIEHMTKKKFLIAREVELKGNEKKCVCKEYPFAFSGFNPNSFTIMFWMYIKEIKGEGTQLLISRGIKLPQVPIMSINEKLHIDVAIDCYEKRFLFSSRAICSPKRCWTHVALTCDREKCSLYNDGTEIKLQKLNSSYLAVNYPFVIGNMSALRGNLGDEIIYENIMDGVLSDISFYPMSLDAEEISMYVEKTKPREMSKIASKPNISNDCEENEQKVLKKFMAEKIPDWSFEMDKQLLEMANKLIERKKSEENKTKLDRTQQIQVAAISRPDSALSDRQSYTISTEFISSRHPLLEAISEFRQSSSGQEHQVVNDDENLDEHDEHEERDNEDAEHAEDDVEDPNELEMEEEEDIDEESPNDEEEDRVYDDLNMHEDYSPFYSQDVFHFVSDLKISEADIDSFSLIAELPIREIRNRLILLRIFNSKLGDALSLIDFTQVNFPWSLAHRVSSLRDIIFYPTKFQIFQFILEKTNSPSKVLIKVNRLKVLKSKQRKDPEGKISVFGQIYRQLHFLNPSLLRYNGRTWLLTYDGEGGQDVGGLFRDSLSAICEDLQKGNVPLLIRCPNGRLGYGNNQDKFVPSPTAISELNLSMLAFLGKVIGIAIRSHSVLNLDLPSVVWKPLVGKSIDRNDITAIDAGFVEFLETVLKDGPNITPENFEEVLPLYFTVTRSDGKEVELVEGGKDIKVTWNDRERYAVLLESFRLKEFELQVNAIKKGLGTIVPINLLSLFTEKELEFMVCGKRTIDIDFLKENTKYERGTRAEDQHIKWLWEVLKEFTHDDRQKFLRFVWGQSRLPHTSEDFREKFTIKTQFRKSDQSLPTSHTCFFSLEIPRYSSKETLRSKLLYAIRHCTSIDADFNPRNADMDSD